MCTYANEHVVVRGSGKTSGTWVPVASASIYVDHPYATPLDHTLNIDLFGEAEGRSRQIAVELSLESAHALLEAITRALVRSGDESIEAP